MTHIMIDLETLGVGPLAAIATIGYSAFDLPDTRIGGGKIQVDIESCVKAGMRIKDSTFRWWMNQSDAARASLQDGAPLDLRDALVKFSTIFNGDEIVWGNGANFDVSILEVAYELCDLPIPWKFYNVGCFRTLKSRLPAQYQVPKIEPEVPHCAQSDAEAQAIQLQNIMYKLNGG